MANLGERIKLLRKQTNLNQSDFAEKIGLGSATVISRYEKGELEPNTTTLIKIAELANCDPGWLLTGEGEMYREEKKEVMEKEGFIFVPVVSGKISAGGGLAPETTVELKIAFRKDWIQRHGDPKNMSLIRVSGDSMEPTLWSGDMVLVDHSRNYISPQGGIYAIAIDDGIMIKRLQVIYPLKKIRIISDNPKYEPLEADPDQIKINGKIIWFSREIER